MRRRAKRVTKPSRKTSLPLLPPLGRPDYESRGRKPLSSQFSLSLFARGSPKSYAQIRRTCFGAACHHAAGYLTRSNLLPLWLLEQRARGCKLHRTCVIPRRCCTCDTWTQPRSSHGWISSPTTTFGRNTFSDFKGMLPKNPLYYFMSHR
jgi:hypothetical protein